MVSAEETEDTLYEDAEKIEMSAVAYHIQKNIEKHKKRRKQMKKEKLKNLYTVGATLILLLSIGCSSNESSAKPHKKAKQLKPYSTELVREMFIKKEIVNLDVTSWDASKSTGFQRCFPTKKSVCRKFIELQKEKERLSS